MEFPRIASLDPNSDQSPLYDVRNHACNHPGEDEQHAKWCFADDGRHDLLQSDWQSTIWWSQTGSNRRPHACKARALPAELWPLTRRATLRHSSVNPETFPRLSHNPRRRAIMVGLGRFELPTSRLSSARSNQLSYKPLARET